MKKYLNDLGISETFLTQKVGRVLTDSATDFSQLLETFALVSLSSLIEPGDKVMGKLLHTVPAVEALTLLLNNVQYQQLQGMVPDVEDGEWQSAVQRWLPRLKLNRVKQILDATFALGAKIITPSSVSWPVQLNDLGESAPIAFWAIGDHELLQSRKSIAIVGARVSTAYGEQVTAEFASGLSLKGWTIFSGGAYGIDAMSHRATLNSGGKTVAVLAGGIDQLYPAGNVSLLEKIREHGLLLAEQPPGTVPSRWRFLQRNRLLAALSQMTLVVEAGYRSGAINTASHACHIGRELAVVPGPITSRSSDGCHRILREMPSTCVTSVEEVAEILEGPNSVSESETVVEEDISVGAKRVMDSLYKRKPSTISQIASSSGLAVAEVSKELFALELLGAIRRTSEGYVKN